MGSLISDLGDRDRQVLQSVADHRFLTTRQIERLHFADHATPLAGARICRRVLARLVEQRVLHRLERRIGGVRAGSASYIWSVGPAGDRLLRLASGQSARRHHDEPSQTFLWHTLAVADAYVTMKELERTLKVEMLTVEIEPTCWRRFTSVDGNTQTLRPDLFAVTAERDYEDHWFVEVDRDTESLPAVLRKCAQYEAYRKCGREQERSGTFPLVVWLVPSSKRLEQLRAGILRARELNPAVFRLALMSELAQVITEPDHYVTRKEAST